MNVVKGKTVKLFTKTKDDGSNTTKNPKSLTLIVTLSFYSRVLLKDKTSIF